MSEGISLLAVLLLISATLCALMTLAWRSFGLAVHARFWAWAFGVATVQWAVNLAYHLMPSHPLPLVLIVSILSVVVSGLWLEGFRQRAGLDPAWRWLGGGAAAVTVLMLVVGLLPLAKPVALALAMGLRAVLLIKAATLVSPRTRRANAAECGAVAFLLTFAAFSLLIAALATLRIASGIEPIWQVARLTLRFGIPTAFTGLGLFAVFLLASDLCEQMRTLALADPLTGLLNRRGFDDAAARLLAHARRASQPVAVVLTDIDRFKGINDRLGHAAGDRAIKRFAEQLRASVRSDDLVGRIGGDEFVLLLAGADRCAAAVIVERLRARLGETTKLGADLVTASFGIANVADGEPLEAALQRADKALYRSKQDGRDRVTFTSFPATPLPTGAFAAA